MEHVLDALFSHQSLLLQIDMISMLIDVTDGGVGGITFKCSRNNYYVDAVRCFWTITVSHLPWTNTCMRQVSCFDYICELVEGGRG